MLELGKAKADGLIGRFLRDERGTSAIEYAIIASGVSIVIVGTVATWARP
jgi:Flp pilus assembly pilin Flp